MIFCDWITAVLPYEWEDEINGGRFISLDRKDKVAKEIPRRLNVAGAFGSSLAIRTDIDRKGKKLLEVSGNVTKFLQGHNAFGSNDVLALVNKTIDVLCTGYLPTTLGYSSEELEILKETGSFDEREPNSFYQVRPSAKERDSWAKGYFRLRRIDLTAMVQLSSRAEVRAVMRALRYTATVDRRGTGSWYDGSLYFGLPKKGKRSNSWMMLIYGKGDQMGLNEVPRNIDDFDSPKAAREWGGDLSEYIPHRDDLCAWIDDKIRIEIRLSSAELAKIGLKWVHCWTPKIAEEVFKTYLKRLNIGGIVCDAVEDNPSLPLSLRRTFSEWKRGVDVRQYMNRQTFSRHRKEILDITGCDISGGVLTEAPRLDLQKILVDEISPAPIPVWALGETDDIPF